MIWFFSNCCFWAEYQVNESMCEPLKRRISVFYSPVVLLDVSSIGLLVFKVRHFGDLSFWCRSKGLGCLM